MSNKRFIILSSPSGGGKTTIARYLINKYKEFSFSISATTRKMRQYEIDGQDYHFITKEVFLQMIENNELVEYEQIFGNYYGTPKSELNRAKLQNKTLIFDVDVKGALSIQKHFPDDSLLIFLSPPSIQILEQRLRNRQTESEQEIIERLNRAITEMKFADQFKYHIINNILDDTISNVEKIIISEIINKK